MHLSAVADTAAKATDPDTGKQEPVGEKEGEDKWGKHKTPDCRGQTLTSTTSWRLGLSGREVGGGEQCLEATLTSGEHQ